MKKYKNVLFVLLILLSSCGVQDNNNTDINVSESLVIEITTEIFNEITTINPNSSSDEEIDLITTTPATISLFPIIAINEEKSFLRIRHPLDDYHYGNELSLTIYNYKLLITKGFIGLTGEEEYISWWNNIRRSGEDFDGDYEIFFLYRMDLREFENLYSFICDFNLSEQQVKDALIEWNEFGVDDFIRKHIYSDEEINALATRNKEEITRLFATPLAIVKGDKIYVPGWFFYSSIEDYKNADITSDDLIAVLDNCRNFQYYGSEIRFGEYTFSHRYLLDLIEYKAYNYLDNNVDVIELCGYERDFSMPMAYDGYYESILNSENGYERYHAFFNTSYSYDTSIYNIIIEENAYSPHWVYYNKPAAYREAGITPDELLEMLPRYEALGILTDEAWAALENKIFDYAESFN